MSVSTRAIRWKRSSEDNWDAEPAEQAALAIEIIWTIASLLQLFYIFKNLKVIPRAARGPYILLAIITISIALYHAFYAVSICLNTTTYYSLISFISAGAFFYAVDTAFRFAVVLYLVHRREDVLRPAQRNTTFPLSARTWKRIMDWSIVAVTFIIDFVATTFFADLLISRVSVNDPRMIQSLRLFSAQIATDLGQYNVGNGGIGAESQMYLGMGQTGFTLFIVLCIDLGLTLVFQITQGRDTSDLVITRLVNVTLPLFGVFLMEVAFFDIYQQVVLAIDDYWAFIIASIFIDGATRVAITAALIQVMTLSGVVSWEPTPAPPKEEGKDAPSDTITPSPQQPPASYWPQPHVLPHEMPKQPFPHSTPKEDVGDHPVYQQPVSEVYSIPFPAPSPLDVSTSAPRSPGELYTHAQFPEKTPEEKV